MIHLSKLSLLMERLDKNRRKVPFSLTFVKSTGELVEIKEAVCTSTFNENHTANIMILPSREIRKIYLVSIIRFNNEVLFL